MSDNPKSEQPIYAPPAMEVMKAVQEVSAQSFRKPDWEGTDLGLALELWFLHSLYTGAIPSHEGEGHPIHAMAAILSAVDSGIAPPKWAAKWLASGFRDYLAEKGEESLEKHLGVAPIGGDSKRRGARFPISQYFKETRSFLCGVLMHSLVEGRGRGPVEASRAIAKLVNGKTPGAIEKSYRNKWRGKFIEQPELVDEWTPERLEVIEKILNRGKQ